MTALSETSIGVPEPDGSMSWAVRNPNIDVKSIPEGAEAPAH